MNCQECQESISPYLDNDLENARADEMLEHLSACAECAKLCEDFSAILVTCRESNPAEIVPPNSQALWCRINNLIESEIKSEPERHELPPVPERRGWSFSFSQVAAAVVGIALISSLLTIVGIRNYFEPSGDDYVTKSPASQTTFEKIMSKVGLSETPTEARMRRIKEQQAVIEYWNKRVEARRAQWDNRLREAFDRNLNEINHAVNEYTISLERDPQDELSGEMLDSALNDKMNLLRQFSEL